MTDDQSERELSGLARSIQRLFQQEAAATAVDEDAIPEGGDDSDVAWVAESGVRLPGDIHAPDPLLEAVRGYIRAEVESRPDRAEAVRAAGRDARARSAIQAMADAAEALARLRGSDPAALELARGMVIPAVAAALVSRVTDAPDDDRRGELLAILPELGPELEMAVLEALRREALDADSDRSARRALLTLVASIAEGGSDLLSRMVADPNWRVARNAVLLVGDRGGEEALPLLRQALVNQDGRVRKEALSALAKLGSEEVEEVAVSYLQDSDPGVRSQAARTVGLVHAERGLRPLLELLETEEDDTVLLEVIRALGLLGDPSAVLPLEKRAVPSLFSRAPSEIRVASYRALAAIGTPHATSLIEKAADDRDPQVRRTVQAILKARDA